MRATPLPALLWALVVAVLTGCAATDQTGGVTAPEATPANTVSSDEEHKSLCERDIPFEPTYLPDGFANQALPGPADGGRPLERKGQVIFHYRGEGSRAIEVRRPGTFFSELAQRDHAPTIDVLGSETRGFAPIEPGGDDFMVQFIYPADAAPHDWCSVYSLNEYGVSLAQLKRVAKGLRRK
jgi:hypothetical protein